MNTIVIIEGTNKGWRLAVIKLAAGAFLARLAVIAADKLSKKLSEDNKDPP